jgi:hypothetical protein
MSDSAWAYLLGCHWDWKRRALALLVVALLLGIGLIAGYFAGDAIASNQAAAAQRAAHSMFHGSGSTPQLLLRLPELGSAQAAALLADADTPGGLLGRHCL